jgi:hypothetical protein
VLAFGVAYLSNLAPAPSSTAITAPTVPAAEDFTTGVTNP